MDELAKPALNTLAMLAFSVACVATASGLIDAKTVDHLIGADKPGIKIVHAPHNH